LSSSHERVQKEKGVPRIERKKKRSEHGQLAESGMGRRQQRSGGGVYALSRTPMGERKMNLLHRFTPEEDDT